MENKILEKYFNGLSNEEILDEFDLLIKNSSSKNFRNLVLMVKDFYSEICRLEIQNENFKTSLDESQEIMSDYKEENKHLNNIITNCLETYSKGLHDGKAIMKKRYKKAIKFIKETSCYNKDKNICYSFISSEECLELLKILL